MAQESRVRIVDIAEELGLSTATVSNVIHGKTGKISDETVKRVQELLERKQYIPSMAGILLAQNDSRIIGVVVNDHEKYEAHVMEDYFIASSLNCLSREIEETGYFMMVKTAKEWSEIARFASMWNMDGLILIGFCDSDYKKLRERMRIPFVVYDGYLKDGERICNLVIDNFDGGFQIGRYFRELGHEKVLCISDNEICVDLERLQGFRAGMGTLGADFLMIPDQKKERCFFYRKHLEKIKRYSAVFAVSDYYALDLMFFLQENGIRIPQDISIAGFDGNPVCNTVYPSLVTVKQDGRERARLAIEKLRLLKEGKEEGCTVKLPVTLMKNQSVRKIERYL